MGVPCLPTAMAVTEIPSARLPMDKPPRPRRWIPVSLRMLMAILVLFGVSSALFIWESDRRDQQLYDRELRVTQEIKTWGGTVGTERHGREWLRTLVGNNRLSGTRERISFVLLDGTSLTDAGLASFHLSELTNLNGVSFDQTKVTDAGLAQLSGLTNLRQVSVNGTAVTDDGLAHLSGLTSLEYVLLAGTGVTDAGLVHLSKLKNIRCLFLSQTAVTDAGLAHLSGLKNLHELFLDGTAVTDRGLVHLKGLTGLVTLRLENTQVTDAGVAELQRTLPDLSVGK